MSGLPLEAMQRWMQEVVVHPGRVGAAVGAPGAAEIVPADAIADVILPSATLDPVERVGIYHGMYLLRMQDALGADYPALQHYLGDRFPAFVAAYVQSHPSRSYTLNRLGDHVPAFVAGSPLVPRRAFAAELARVELAMTEAFDAAETPALSAEQIGAVPEDAWEHAVLRPVASLRLLALRYPVSPWLDATHDEDHHHPAIRRQDAWMVVHRRDYQVYRQDVTRDAHDLLASLVAGTPLGEAIAARLQSRRRVDPDQLFRWFRQWVSSGVFAAVETRPPA